MPDVRHQGMRKLMLLTQVPSAVFALLVAFGAMLAYAAFLRRASILTSRTQDATILEASADISFLAEATLVVGVVGSVAVAVSGVFMARWTLRALEHRVQRVADLAGTVLTGGMLILDEEEDPTDDQIGRLGNDIRSIAGALAERDAAMQDDAFRQRFDGMIQRAMTMADSEPEVFSLMQRALEKTLPNSPAEVLMASAAGPHISIATWSRTAKRPGCPVADTNDCHAVRRGHTVRFEDATAVDACPKLLARDHPAHAGVCIPVSVMGKTAGVLHTASGSAQELQDNQIVDVEALVRHAGARLGMIRALATSKVEAETDPLTGLLNRRSLEARCEIMFVADAVCAVAMCDLDHFKNLNDTYGHDAGDRALRLFSQVLRQSVRPTDVAARYGGEEFVLVLPGSSAEQAALSLERIRSGLARALEAAGGPAFTCSIGVASYPGHGSTLEELLKCTDQALYRAKSHGRDRIEQFDSPEQTAQAAQDPAAAA